MKEAQQMPKIPVIKPEEKKEKKRGGFFFDLFGSGAGSVFRAGGLGGGLLATKAGVIGLAIIGVAVAGGIGLIGYKFFGPTRSDRTGGAMSLFEQRSPEADAGAKGAGDGNSDSLSQLASANQGASGATDAAKAGAASVTDQAKADASVGASATDAQKAAETAKKSAAASADVSLGPRPFRGGKIESKFSGFSGGGSGGSSGASFSAPTQLASAKLAPSTGLSRGSPAAAGGRRGLTGRKFGTAGQQLLGVARDQKGPLSSQTAGATYDGNKGSGIASNGTPTSGGTTPNGVPDANPSLSQGNGADRFPQPPPAVNAVNVTPWQNAIKTAEMLLMAAALLIFLASKAAKFPIGGQAGAYVAAGMAALLAGMAAYIGHQIATGPYGQVFQGQMFVSAGSFLAASAVGMITMQAAHSTTTIMKIAVLGSGALGLGMAIVGAMQPTTSYPPQDFSAQPGGLPPDWDFMKGSHGVCNAGSAGVPGCK